MEINWGDTPSATLNDVLGGIDKSLGIKKYFQ